LSLILLLLGGLLVFAVIGWLTRKPALQAGAWRVPAGVVSIAMLFGGLLLTVRGGWILGVPIVFAAALVAMLARARPAGKAAIAERMGEAEARALLGVGPDATADEIRAAHTRLIRMNHPDAGGTTGLAAQLNAARDRLLRERG
jgi:hypothetical protein